MKCMLTEKGQKISAKRLWFRKGKIVGQSEDCYNVKWDGTKSSYPISKDFVAVIH